MIEKIKIKLKPSQRKRLINELKEICVEIGCSGLNPNLCQNEPHKCDIIKKLVCFAN